MSGFALVAFTILQVAGAAGGEVDRLAAPDSARLVRSSRSAQWSFEAFRRQHLPMAHGSGGGTCDARVGRYCYWRGDEDEEHQPEEPSQIVRRRDDLLRTLDSAAVGLPGDPWIAGQLVRYLVEAGRTDRARRFAQTDCRAGAAWCAALDGYVEHNAGHFAAADSAYRAALASMEPDERCRWLDVSTMVDDETSDRLRKLDCVARAAAVRRMLEVGAPLYSVSFTDLYTEHLARVTRAQMAERAATADGESWADDQRDLTLRYGWPRWYSRSLPTVSEVYERVAVTGHDKGKPYDFLLPGRALDRLAHVTTADWMLDDPRALTGYAPSYAKSVHDVPSQIALFRRGESTLVVGAWDARRDTTLLGRTLVAALAIAGDKGDSVLARDSSAKAAGRIMGTGVADSGLVSLELLAVADRRAARVRIGLPPRTPGRVALSSLLLYSPTAEPAYDIAAVKDSALASTVVPASRAVGVYWEAYGLRENGEPVHYSLTVEQVGVSWTRRAFERLHLADPTTALRLQWDEVAQPHGGLAGRGVRVDLSRLRGGRYVVTLDVSTRSAEHASTAKEIVIR